VLTVDPTTHHLAWATPSGGGGGGSLTVEEVDGSPTDSAVTKLVFPNGTLGIASHVATYTPAGGGGGGLTQAYVGYNSIGGTGVSPTNRRHVVQKVTLANDCLLTDIQVYVKQISAANAMSWTPLLYSDNAGKPYYFLSGGAPHSNSGNTYNLYRVGATPGDARWMGMPIGRWLTAGDYWIGFVWNSQGAQYNVFYDASGTSYIWDPGGNIFITDGPDTSGTVYTLTAETRSYSIRANTIR
jgi:hypothetical protein